MLPTVKVYLSCPVLRLDHAKAGFTLYQLVRKMKTLENVIVNDNIYATSLGKAGLHLNCRGFGSPSFKLLISNAVSLAQTMLHVCQVQISRYCLQVTLFLMQMRCLFFL